MLSPTAVETDKIKNEGNRHHTSLRTSEETLAVSEPVKAEYKTVFDYHAYRLADQSPHYDDEFARKAVKMPKRLEVQLTYPNFGCSISILSFLPSFQRGCYKNRILESAAMLQFHIFMDKLTSAALSADTSLIISSRWREEGKVTS